MTDVNRHGRWRQSWLQTFARALAGLARVVADERNAKIHLLATAGAIVAGWGLGLATAEWAAVVLAMGMVWMAECLNTALERLADVVCHERDARIGAVKDLAAGGVLAAALSAAAVGLIIFGPRLWALVVARAPFA